jgi:hypothetical protein
MITLLCSLTPIDFDIIDSNGHQNNRTFEKFIKTDLGTKCARDIVLELSGTNTQTSTGARHKLLLTKVKP